MKKTFCLFLAMLLLLGTCGCRQTDEIHFYYPRVDVRYDISDGVITYESRDISRDSVDLSYMLKLYLEGPISQELYSPFPQGTALESISYAGKQLFILMNESYATLDNVDYTIACICIASTCFALTDAASVTIKTTYTSITLTPDMMVLDDTVTAP